MTPDLTPAILVGTPIGSADGDAACDTCNRRLTGGERNHDSNDAEVDTVYAYATRAEAPESGTWALRWVSCESCGPPGMADADHPPDRDPSEVVAKATLAYDGRIDAFALADPEHPTDNEKSPFEGGDSA